MQYCKLELRIFSRENFGVKMGAVSRIWCNPDIDLIFLAYKHKEN